ncbi:unnamed protein product [Caenorhabditis angaria]|uniref:ELM2 domain-containing protein n=1 Tax=Caenorhabditis angaria TaxID=860376 RepID=A0A9P1N2A4_9PELO|nr:unnamed protein product [Caenorhabditis angaria]
MQRTLTGSTPSILYPVNIEPTTSTSEKYTIVPDKALMATSEIKDDLAVEKQELEVESLTTDDSRTPSPAIKMETEVKKEEILDEAMGEIEIEQKTVFTDLNIDTNIAKIEGPTSSLSSSSSNYGSTASPSTSALDENQQQQQPVKKRRASRKAAVIEEASRKSNRINKTLEKNAEVIDNYTGQKDLGKPRGNQFPVGLKRQSYDFPSKILKENGRLRIDMNGPSTRSNPAEEACYTPLRNRARGSVHGPEYQASLPSFSPKEEFEEDNCREEAIWVNPQSNEQQKRISDEELNLIYITIQKQYGETMPLDAILHRLMECDYNLDEMLATIEKERERLPQPFLKLSNVQQAEFERQLRKLRTASNSTNRTIPRSHRNMQERFMRSHYLGEIINYYYTTKKKCCSQKQFNRCKCRENMTSVEKLVERVECSNCTKIARPNAEKLGLLCLLCKLYYERNQKHRDSHEMFNDEEEKLLKKWNEMETELGQIITLEDVRNKLEEERVADISTRQLTSEEISALGPYRKRDRSHVAKLFSTFESTYNQFCDPSAEPTSNIRLKDYSDDEKFEFIQAFEKFGKDYEKVANALKCSELEVATFYFRFQRDLNLAEVISEAQNNNNNRSKEKERNTSRDSTPYEPSEKVSNEKPSGLIRSTINTRKRTSDVAISAQKAGPPKRRSRGI